VILFFRTTTNSNGASFAESHGLTLPAAQEASVESRANVAALPSAVEKPQPLPDGCAGWCSAILAPRDRCLPHIPAQHTIFEIN
jgi:hypothetical protein